MARRNKPKAQASSEIELAAAIGITVERYRRDDWDRKKPVVRDGQLQHPHHRRSRVAHFVADKWTDEAGGAALALYEGLVEGSAYGRARSCLDMTPVGHGDGGAPPSVARARDDLARIRNAVTSPVALTITHELLMQRDTVEAITARLMNGGREARIAKAKAMVGLVAGELAEALLSRRIIVAMAA